MNLQYINNRCIY